MKDYSGWKEKHAYVTSLQLDPQNPRIPPTPAELKQRELIAELIAHDDVYELAKDIAEKGYWPLESLIGLVEPDGKTYVLEGNRRLAALKILIQPDLAPDKHLKRFKNLAANIDTEKLKRVRVLHAPTREAAAPLIMQRHTQTQVEKWSVLMQARFLRGLIKEGVPLEEVTKQYGIAAGEIAKSLRLDTMYAAACAILLAEDVRTVVQDPRNFNASVLERIIEVPKAREFLGIEFDPSGKLKGKIDVREFQKVYARILTDIVTDKINTRILNKASDVENYLRTLGNDAPKGETAGKFSIEDLATASPTPPAASPKLAAKPPKSRKATKVAAALIPRGFKCHLSNQRIREVFGELQTLRVDDFPNACGMMLRVLLDLSVGYYMDKTGKIQPLLDKGKKDKKPPEWFPTLNMMLSEMNQDSALPLSPLAKKRLNKMLSDKNSLLSVNLLDSFAHNRFELPTSRDLRGLWDTFEGLFALTLDEPSPPPENNPKKAR